MNIIFNLVKCGMGNNGGTQTILRSALKLREFGHNAKILLDKPNKFTWFDFDKDVLRYIDPQTPYKDWPKCDVMVATGCSTVIDTVRYPHIDIRKKYYWVRAIETWAMLLSELKNGYRSGLNILVNSEWQYRFMHDMRIRARIQYPGIPIKDIMSEVIHRNDTDPNGRLRIGALMSTKSRKCPEAVVGIANLAYESGFTSGIDVLSNENQNKYLDMFGLPFTVYIRPTFSKKIKMMSSCDVWLATTVNEGLHIPPMEAGLSRCGLVVKGLNSSGMQDYAIHGLTALMFLADEEAIDAIGYYFENRHKIEEHNQNFKRLIHSKIGDVETNMRKLEKILSENL